MTLPLITLMIIFAALFIGLGYLAGCVSGEFLQALKGKKSKNPFLDYAISPLMLLWFVYMIYIFGGALLTFSIMVFIPCLIALAFVFKQGLKRTPSQ